RGAAPAPPAVSTAGAQKSAGRRPPLDRPGHEEERRREKTVVDHLQNGSRAAEIVQREETDRDEAHLCEARIRDDASDIRRPEGDQGAVDEAHRGEREDEWSEIVR